MTRIASDKLTPGMKLIKPIVGNNGMVILSEGTELTEKWIERIQDMDVEGIFVEGSSQPTIPLDEALSDIEKRFEPVQNEPYMGLIKKVIRDHIESLYT